MYIFTTSLMILLSVLAFSLGGSDSADMGGSSPTASIEEYQIPHCQTDVVFPGGQPENNGCETQTPGNATTPEPATMLLLGPVLFGLAWRQFRKK